MAFVEIDNLAVTFRREGREVRAVRGVSIAIEPRECKAIEAREKAVEQPPEGRFVAAHYSPGQRPVHVDRVVHTRVRSVISSLDGAWGDYLRAGLMRRDTRLQLYLNRSGPG